MSVGANIKRMRKAADMTQEQLAEKLEVARSTVTQWEKGWSNPRIGMAQKTPLFVKMGYGWDMLHTVNCTGFGTWMNHRHNLWIESQTPNRWTDTLRLITAPWLCA